MKKRYYMVPKVDIVHVEIGHCQNPSLNGAGILTTTQELNPSADFWNVPSVN